MAISVSFIGSGNLAWHLAPALDNAGYPVKEVWSRNKKHAAALTERLYQAEVKDSLDFSTSSSTIFIIAVSDDAIELIAQEISLPENVILAHTSGAQSLGLLGYVATSETGVFYPLQTFSKVKKVNFKDVPVFVESETEYTKATLLKMAGAISERVSEISSADRLALHVAAVFASNFTNYMLTLSKEVMDQNDLNFEWLKPLIAETLNKSLSIGPENSQTGPAKRSDFEVLDKHLEFLSNDDEKASVYKMISQNIIDRYSKE